MAQLVEVMDAALNQQRVRHLVTERRPPRKRFAVVGGKPGHGIPHGTDPAGIKHLLESLDTRGVAVILHHHHAHPGLIDGPRDCTDVLPRARYRFLRKDRQAATARVLHRFAMELGGYDNRHRIGINRVERLGHLREALVRTQSEVVTCNLKDVGVHIDDPGDLDTFPVRGQEPSQPVSGHATRADHQPLVGLHVNLSPILVRKCMASWEASLPRASRWRVSGVATSRSRRNGAWGETLASQHEISRSGVMR